MRQRLFNFELQTVAKNIAKNIEEDMYRIEKENWWASSFINGAIAGAAVGLIAWLVATIEADLLTFSEGDILLFACLGSSSAAVVFAPVARTNSLRSILLAYIASAVVCLILFPIKASHIVSIPIQCALAVCLSIFFMRMIDALHPAAVGSALAFVIYEQRDMRSLMLLMLAIIGLLTIVKLLAYIYLKELTFAEFPREFRRSFYGRELTVTVEDNSATLRAADVPRSPLKSESDKLLDSANRSEPQEENSEK